MANFIDYGATFINLDQVRRVAYNYNEKKTTFHYTDGHSETIIGQLLPDTNHLVAAVPGYFLLTARSNGEGGVWVERLPILARKYGGRDEAIPVTYDKNRQDDPLFTAILSPDGQVISPYEDRWKDETEWLAWMKDLAAEELKEQQAAKESAA
jgi:hypothetical protein